MTEDTTRLEAFSDGVFAIAITLLVLELRVPGGSENAELWAGLRALWPSYLAFVLSFFVILLMWVNHHELLRLLQAVDYPLLFANGFVLLMVTFVPFPTAVLAQHLVTPAARAAVGFYCGTFIVVGISWALLFRVMVGRGLIAPDVDAATIARIGRANLIGPLVYILATGVALVNAIAGLILNASLWVLWARLGYRPERQSSGGTREPLK